MSVTVDITGLPEERVVLASSPPAEPSAARTPSPNPRATPGRRLDVTVVARPGGDFPEAVPRWARPAAEFRAERTGDGRDGRGSSGA